MQKRRKKGRENNMETMRTRNHFSYIFEQLGGGLVAIFVLIIGQQEMLTEGIEYLRQGKILEALIGMGALLVLLGAILGFSAWRWYRTIITVSDGMLTIERNTLNRKKNTIAVQNISNINLEQNLFEMVMGTYKLKLDTSSLSTADETDVKIVLKKADAYAMKDLIMRMIRDIQGENGEETPEFCDFMDDRQEEQYDITYSTKEIIKNCAMNTSIFAVIFAIGIFISSIFTIKTGISSGKGGIGVIIGVLFQFILGLDVVWSLVKKWMADYRFRAKREGDKIYVRCGLLKIRKYAVPVEKINAISIRFTLISRLCKHAYVKVINVGGEDEDVDGMKLMLFEPLSTLKEHLNQLLPEVKIPDMELIKQPARVLLINIIVCTFYVACAGACFTGVYYVTTDVMPAWWMYVILAGIYAFALLCVLLSYVTAGLAVLEDALVIRRGVFGKTIEIIPYEKIQYIHVDNSLIDRLTGIAHGHVSILASVQSRIQSFKRFPKEDIENLISQFRRTYH